MKIHYDSSLLITNPDKTYSFIRRNIMNSIDRNEKVEQYTLASSIINLGKAYQNNNAMELMVANSLNFIKELIKRGEYDLSGIVISSILKLDIKNPTLIEILAKKGKAIAQKNKDPFHHTARTHDLCLLYRQQCYGSQKHLNALYDAKDDLKYIVSNYEKAITRFSTIHRVPKPVKSYEFMLCTIRMEIAKAVMDKYPIQAAHELNKAYQLIYKYGNGTLVQRIIGLMNKINAKN